MRTTVSLSDDLLKQSKKRLGDEGRTLTSLIEDALRHIVAKPKVYPQVRVEIPVSKVSGGVL